MEDIITERFNYATITPLKDYCRLDEKKKLSASMTDGLDGLEDDFSRKTIKSTLGWDFFESPKITGRIVTLPKKNKKRVNYFYDDNVEVHEGFNLSYAIKDDGKNNCSFQTTKDRHIKNHFGKPFSDISVSIIERSVRRHGDKVTIKLYRHEKYRKFNSIYFRKSFSVQSVTINTVTGNFTTLTMGKSSKSNSQTFRTNCFQSLFNLIGGTSFFSVKSKLCNKQSRIYQEFQDSFDDITFTSKIQEALNIEDGYVDYSSNPEQFINDMMTIFIRNKKIKVPNGDYEHYLTKLYPTEKYLKKNDRKLIASVLDMLGIKTKATIKIVHENPNIDIYGLCRFIKYFDNDYAKYIGNVRPEVFKKSNRRYSIGSYNDNCSKSVILSSGKKFYGLLDVEKENLIKVVNSFTLNDGNNTLSDRFIQLIDDHLSMIERVRDYDPSLYFKSRNMEEFHAEHRELSKIISAIKKGWVIEYQYDDKLLKDLEAPIKCLLDDNTLHTLYPYILKREEDYVEEGSFMHHCVASYSDKDRSMIVSLRDKTGLERVTCEFDIQSGRCIQQRYFCNAQPPSKFEDGLLIVSEKIATHARWGTLNWKDKKKVPIKINGIDIMEKLPTTRVTDIFEDLRLPFARQ